MDNKISSQTKNDILNGKGTKDDIGKLNITISDPHYWEEVCKVMTAGANKYKRANWQQDLEADRLLDALLRHAISIWKGQEYDEDTGLRHSAHIGCNAMFLNFAERHGKGVKLEHDKG